MRSALFAYNIPHKKTQDFMLRLKVIGAEVSVILAADPVQLNIPPSVLRIKPKLTGLIHPREIAQAFGWRYEVVDHTSARCAELLRETRTDVGVISGARILKEPIVSVPPLGIINYHPGLLPEVRGLDALQWAIQQDLPIGITAHIIDSRVDAGRLLHTRTLNIHPAETLMEVAMRLQDEQAEMLPESLRLLEGRKLEDFPALVGGKLNRKMPPELEGQIPDLFAQRQAKAAKP